MNDLPEPRTSQQPHPTPSLGPATVVHSSIPSITSSKPRPLSPQRRLSVTGALQNPPEWTASHAPASRSKSAPRSRPDPATTAARRPTWNGSTSETSVKPPAHASFGAPLSSARSLQASSSNKGAAAQTGGVIFEVMPVTHRSSDSSAPWVPRPPQPFLPASQLFDQSQASSRALNDSSALISVHTAGGTLAPSMDVKPSRAAIRAISSAPSSRGETSNRGVRKASQLRRKWSVPGSVPDAAPCWLSHKSDKSDKGLHDAQEGGSRDRTSQPVGPEQSRVGQQARRHGDVEMPSKALRGPRDQRHPNTLASSNLMQQGPTATTRAPKSPQGAPAPRAMVYAAADIAASRPKRAFLWADRSRISLRQPLTPM